MSIEEMTVFVVDDDEAVRESLNDLLDSVGLNVETFSSAQDFLEVYELERQGCLVLDIRMPFMSGLELQEELIKRGAILPIIFITGHGDVPMAVQAIQRGAHDFVQKPFRDQDLLDRINHALAQYSTEFEDKLQKTLVNKHIQDLTSREREVMDLIVAGKANKVIAIDLNLSQRTVEVHRANVMEKLEARSLADLVRIVTHAGII